MEKFLQKIRRDGSSVSSLAMRGRLFRLQVTDTIQIMDGVGHLFKNNRPFNGITDQTVIKSNLIHNDKIVNPVHNHFFHKVYKRKKMHPQ